MKNIFYLHLTNWRDSEHFFVLRWYKGRVLNLDASSRDKRTGVQLLTTYTQGRTSLNASTPFYIRLYHLEDRKNLGVYEPSR